MANGAAHWWPADLPRGDGAEANYRSALDLLEVPDDWWIKAEALSGLVITLACHRGDVEAALPLEIAWEAGDLAGVALDLEWLGQAAVAGGGADRGVTLAGAASRLREAVGAGITVQAYRWEPEHPRDAARRFMGERKVDTAWARGRAMSLEEAVAHARGGSAGGTETT